jgi:tetratricopeptide (TPR) repeat protein
MRKTIETMMLALALVGAGCAGSSGEKGEAKTAADEAAPPPPSDEKIAAAKQQQELQQQAKPKALTKEEKKKKALDRADFDAAVAKWEAAKKAGTLKAADSKALASTFQSLASSHPDVAAQAHHNAGVLLDAAGDAKGAESEYNAALSANPAYGPAIASLGEVYYRSGSPQRAKEWFEKAINADPTHVSSAYNNLALIIFQEAKDQGNAAGYKDAVAKLRRALAIDNNSMPAYALLALIYYTSAENDRSKLALAEVVVKQAKETDDKYAPIYNTNGLILLRKKLVTNALKEFERAVELDPRFVEAYLNIGAISLSTRQYEKAEKAFSSVLGLQPNNVDATIGIGVAYRGEKKIDEAEKSYQKAKQLDPKNCAVPYNMGVLYQDYKNAADNSNLREAQKFYNEFVSCGRGDQKKVADAQRRIKDIDDTFVALEEQKKMEAQLKEQQAEMEKQQKAMEEQQKQQEAAAKAAEANKPAAPAAPAEDKAAKPKK